MLAVTRTRSRYNSSWCARAVRKGRRPGNVDWMYGGSLGNGMNKSALRRGMGNVARVYGNSVGYGVALCVDGRGLGNVASSILIQIEFLFIVSTSCREIDSVSKQSCRDQRSNSDDQARKIKDQRSLTSDASESLHELRTLLRFVRNNINRSAEKLQRYILQILSPCLKEE